MIGFGVVIPLVFMVTAFFASEVPLIWRLSISLVVFGIILIIVGVFRDKKREEPPEEKY